MPAIPSTVSIVTIMTLMSTSAAERADYLGAAGCASCHPTQTATWRKGPHGRAAASLGRDAQNPWCQSCHSTEDAPAGRAYFSNVGCEACHGAGAAYGLSDIMRNRHLARALGLQDLSNATARRQVCMRCHIKRTRLSVFDSERAWQRIGHSTGASARQSVSKRKQP